jgi:hypothetical protein
MNIYSSPEKFALTTIGEVDWSDGDYVFDYTVVWQRAFDGRFVYAEDSGCSRPSPFEDIGIEDLVVLRKRGGLDDFKAHCEQRQSAGSYDRSLEVAELLERMHAAGAR